LLRKVRRRGRNFRLAFANVDRVSSSEGGSRKMRKKIRKNSRGVAYVTISTGLRNVARGNKRT